VSDTYCIQLDDVWYQATTNYTLLTDGSQDLTMTSITLEQLNGFEDSEIARTIQYDADTNQTIVATYLDRSQNKITQVTTKPATSTLPATTIIQNGRVISSSTLSVSSPTCTYYDALGRTNRVQDPLGFSTTLTYESGTGWLSSVTDPLGRTTSYQYYGVTEANAGKLKCQTSPAGKKTYYAYTSRGELFRTWGDVPYPAEYHYSEYGDMTNLVTFRGGSGWAASSWPANPGTGDNTYWLYDEASGALLQKIDAQNRATTYTYNTTTGRLETRSWARTVAGVPVMVTNLYNGFGDLVAQNYNDSTPWVAFNNYNRAGLPREIIDATGTNELTYDHANRLLTTYCPNGLLAGITVSNHFDARYGRDALSVLSINNPLSTINYFYDSYGRLGTVSSGVYSAEYGYLANSDLLATTTCKNNGSTVLTTTRSWEYGMRLGSIVNEAGGAVVSSHAYEYDALNRRTRASLEDGSCWRYAYNDRDELTGARRYWPGQDPVTGQQFAYDYDNIGNRKSASSGGDAHGGNLRQTTYAANELNQYTSIFNPGYKDILGVALATNSVTVNRGPADRKVEYFHREISVANDSGPLWQNVSVTSGAATANGALLAPAQNQTLAYNADGNLSFDGTWTYDWDAENRLKAMTMTNIVANLVNSNRLRLDFVYDYQGRRTAKTVRTWGGGNFTNAVTTLFAYDGWNLVAELRSPNSPIQTYVWGNDLGGTMTKAGGVEGLVMLTVCDATRTNCFMAYDGKGNVVCLADGETASIMARYEYSPFGETIRTTGPMARQSPFRYSTRFCDEETRLIYYGFRYFGPSLGRWVSRDPIGENGGVNLMGFVKNRPPNAIDKYGQDGSEPETLLAGEESAEMDAEGGGAAVGIYNRVKAMVQASNAYQRLGSMFMAAEAAKGGDDIEALEAFLAEGNAIVARGVQSGQNATTVLGRYGTDMNLFIEGDSLSAWGKMWQSLGHNILSMPSSWTSGQQAYANLMWLSQSVAHGDSIYLATSVAEEAGATYPLELQFLQLLGYARVGDYMIMR
jgi:RHS repeat-associated protein